MLCMRLFYCDHLPNFGDRLNSWLWPRLLPDHLDARSPTLLVGVGTLLSEGMAPWATKVVLGAGAPNAKPMSLDGSWCVYGVRGPLTARALGLPASAALCDPAVLVPLLNNTSRIIKTEQTRVGFMPHHLSANLGDWQRVCTDAGLTYIDPRAPTEDVLRDIARVPMLITEALHGAIVADALRTPWVPVQAYTHINRFKWQDWCASLALDYAPQHLPPLWDGVKHTKPFASARLAAKTAASSMGWWHKRWRPLHPTDSSDEERTFVTERLVSLANGYAQPQLSRSGMLERAQERLLTAVTRVKHEWPPCSAAVPAPRERESMQLPSRKGAMA
jgi:succinoglycan biosynthesis protein ExoV